MRFASLILTVGCGLCLAQQPPQPVIRSATRLVQISVIATDKSGAPVANLSQDEFELAEDGKKQAIRFFSLEQGETPVAGAKTLPAGFFSNRLEYRGDVPNSATAILIDRLNTPLGYMGRMRPHLSRFLHQVDPRARVAIYSLGREFQVLHDFTTDTALLTRKLGEVRDVMPRLESREWLESVLAAGDPSRFADALTGQGGGDILDLMAFMLSEGARKEAEIVNEDHTLTTLRAIEAIARRLSAIPGRKNLVWVSTGFPLAMGVETPLVIRGGSPVRQRLFTLEFQRAVRALNDASVAVYPVDARGLLALSEVSSFTAPKMVGVREKPMKFDADFVTPSMTTMKSIAERTGGKMFFGEEIDEALPLVFQHARVSYTLAYYPANQNYDGKFRKLRVKTTRHDVRLDYRSGYHALPDARESNEERKSALLGAVWSPVDATSIALDAMLEQSACTAPGERTLVLRVDGRGLIFEPAGEGALCQLDLYVVQKDAAGRQLDGLADHLDIRATTERASVLGRQGITHRRAIQLKPGASILRVVARNAGGALGSLSIRLN